MYLYVASSWKNTYHDKAVEAFTKAGIECYNYRKPSPGVPGFGWSSVGVKKDWKTWNIDDYRKAVVTTRAQEGFNMDMRAMVRADACCLILPSGASAHMEAGWFSGKERPVCVFAPEFKAPDNVYLMYKMMSEDAMPPVYDAIEDVIIYLKNNTGMRARAHMRKKA